ncbi:L-rhamnose mutarotase [Sphingomonas gilva]|uniref:L-rhamnose mutarotase n=1 Tax=Sphingomonas gilva TaxID=2305907 RepID=A0A396RQN9_9SPHN|nr:L-rhamnose mutarotase [Sphingomonas gilva]RHW18937.1 L-rhamnose mutarotase [Sphingomonas gilva]
MRHILLLDLKDEADLIARYERHHAPGAVPEAVTASIRAAGVTAMEIFRSGNRLVMVVEAEAGFDSAGQSNPSTAAWEAMMDEFQQRLPWAPPGRKWVPAARIFSLDEQGDR